MSFILSLSKPPSNVLQSARKSVGRVCKELGPHEVARRKPDSIQLVSL